MGLFRFVESNFLKLLLPFVVLLAWQPALRALPQAAVDQKLLVILTYMIFESKDGNVSLVTFKSNDGTSPLAPIFMAKEDAMKMATVEGKDNSSKVVLGIPLNQALIAAKTFRDLPPGSGAAFKSPIVPFGPDVKAAKEILLAEGLSLKQINSGLDVPVFYTDPMVLINTSAGERQAFFFEISQLKTFVEKNFSRVDQATLKYKVADLRKVLSLIKDNPKDKYTFYPNPAYLEASPSVFNENL